MVYAWWSPWKYGIGSGRAKQLVALFCPLAYEAEMRLQARMAVAGFVRARGSDQYELF